MNADDAGAEEERSTRPEASCGDGRERPPTWPCPARNPRVRRSGTCAAARAGAHVTNRRTSTRTRYEPLHEQARAW